MRELRVAWGAEAASTTARVYDATGGSSAALILAHGAGAGQESPFVVSWARGLAARGLPVVTFDFLYMAQRRKVPDRSPVLEGCYQAVIAAVRREMTGGALFIGGKSMGGRISTQVAAADRALPVRGLVLLGYPLHPPGRPERRRDAHLPSVARPMLFVQGSRDAFGTPEELRPVLERIDPRPDLEVVDGGDHSFKVAGTGAAGQARIQENLQDRVVRWIQALAG